MSTLDHHTPLHVRIEPHIAIALDDDRRQYQPGETLAGQFALGGWEGVEVRAVELSVLWFTEGKGSEDLAVHHFARLAPGDASGFDPRRPHRFQVALPACPLSYDGQIVRIVWCVRVRAFPTRGKEVLAELPFRLGSVPPPESSP